jgi:glycine cleavage system H lipoate-binding protein
MVALFVLGAFIFFIVLDLAVLKVQGKTHPAFENILSITDLTILPEMEIKVPDSVALSKGHMWIRKNKHGLVEVGTDEFISKSLGNITIQNNLVIGKEVKRGDVLIEGILKNKKIKFLSPINGVVKSINSTSSDAVNSEPYSNWNVELSSGEFIPGKGLFLSGRDALNWLKQEFIKLDNFLMEKSVRPELAGVTMYDGGKVVEGVSGMLIKDIAEDFEKEFLSL